jgi:transposase
MGYVTGECREQLMLLPESLDAYVGEGNAVRVIDAYIEGLDLNDMGFNYTEPKATGRPPYSPYDLIKLFIYGYMNRIRSSRRLQTETMRNLELMWLLKKLSPDHVTIARFRSENAQALKGLFKDFVRFCRDLGLYGRELAGIDGSKFEAVNSNDRNFNDKKLAGRIARLDAQIDAYLQEMKDADNEESRMEEAANRVGEALEELEKRKALYQAYRQELADNGETQKSLTDPESRKMISNGRSDLCYNVQSSVDSLNKMIAEFEVTNECNDKNQLSKLAKATAEVLETGDLEVTADKGYDNASEVAACIMAGITPHVMGSDYDICLPAGGPEASGHVDEPASHHQGRCVYLPDRNVVLCPMGKVLYPSYYNKSHRVGVYSNGKACSKCACKCTEQKSKRHEVRMPKEKFTKEHDADGLGVKQVRVKADKEKADLRKSIAEHPFGTVKRAMDADYVLTKGITKVTGEFSLVFLAYNLKRAINILGANELIRLMNNRHKRAFFSNPARCDGYFAA